MQELLLAISSNISEVGYSFIELCKQILVYSNSQNFQTCTEIRQNFYKLKCQPFSLDCCMYVLKECYNFTTISRSE